MISLKKRKKYDLQSIHRYEMQELANIHETRRNPGRITENSHPEFKVLDDPDAIQQVHNWQSVLQDVAELNLYYGNFVR